MSWNWNSVDNGPHRDLVGKQGLARTWAFNFILFGISLFPICSNKTVSKQSSINPYEPSGPHDCRSLTRFL